MAIWKIVFIESGGDNLAATFSPDLAADLERMRTDAEAGRAGKPFLFMDLKSGQGVTEIVDFLKEQSEL